MIKPDGVQRSLIHKIIKRFEVRGYQLIAMKMKMPSVELLTEHYAELKDKPFFPPLIDYMSKGPVVCMVWKGTDAVAQARRMLGETNPLQSNAGSIRGDFCIEVGRNIIHASDSVASAQKEINLWFNNDELCKWESATHNLVYEK